VSWPGTCPLTHAATETASVWIRPMALGICAIAQPGMKGTLISLMDAGMSMSVSRIQKRAPEVRFATTQKDGTAVHVLLAESWIRKQTLATQTSTL